MILNLLASIPSPSSNAIEIGPLAFRAYGLMIAFGVIAAVVISQRRFVASGGGTTDHMTTVAMWGVPAGLIGARLYHVITDNQLYRGRWVEAFYIWQGGLGIPGGIALGALVGVLVVKRLGLSVPKALDAAAPAIPVAQAIGRLGNWFNQELFGKPTDLPWAVEITNPVALRQVPEQYADETLFHPTFAYEALWNLGVVAVIIALTRWGRLKSGRLFPVYMVGYGVGRLIMEALRIDPANTIGGLRVNTWMSLALIVSGLIWIFWKGALRDAETETAAGKNTTDKADTADKNAADEVDVRDKAKSKASNSKASKSKTSKDQADKVTPKS